MIHIENIGKKNKICFEENEMYEFSDVSYVNLINNFGVDLKKIKNIGVIAINKNTYEKYRGNKFRLLVLLAMLTLKEEKMCEFDKKSVMYKMNLIQNYFNIDSPEVLSTGVYFKPDAFKIDRIFNKIKKCTKNYMNN